MELCIEDIRQWMGSHYLKLNDTKTEFVLFGTDKDIGRVTGWTVSVGDAEILPSCNARNIGAYLDSEMKMTAQIANIIRTCYCQLRSIAQIKKIHIKRCCHKIVPCIHHLPHRQHECPPVQYTTLSTAENPAYS